MYGKLKSRFVQFVSLLLLVSVSGCQSFKEVTISSDPGGATIYLNGAQTGVTPLEKKLRFDGRGDCYRVLARKEGYQDKQDEICCEPKSKTNYNLKLEKIETVSIELVSFEPEQTEEGVRLVIKRRPTLAYLETIERSPNAKSVTRVTNNEDDTLKMGGPILSPVEDVLVYEVIVKETDGSSYSNIWKTVVGSFGKTRVTYGKWLDSFPSFTGDGQHLVFSSNRTRKNPTLWRIRVTGGGGITNITNTLAEDYSPSVSPDGNTIAYTSNLPEADEPQIWTINADGSLPTQLREGRDPKISPDGKEILFVRSDKMTDAKQIWVMNLSGGEETQLTQNTDFDALNPQWSADGEWIAYCCNQGVDSKKRPNFDIWVMTADGSKKTQLTTNGSWDDHPCWDHSGKFIYFRSNRGGAWNIWRFEPVLP